MVTAILEAGSLHHALIANSEFQIKLVTLLNECCDHLSAIPHDPADGNKSRDKKQLYLAMIRFKKDLIYLKKNNWRLYFRRIRKQTRNVSTLPLYATF